MQLNHEGRQGKEHLEVQLGHEGRQGKEHLGVWRRCS